MKDYAKTFYSSTAWKKCRDAYKKSVGGLCEICLKKGRYTPGVIVHHKRHIDPETITDPSVLLAWDNLQLVCRECHAEEHKNRVRRFYVDEEGHVIAKSD